MFSGTPRGINAVRVGKSGKTRVIKITPDGQAPPWEQLLMTRVGDFVGFKHYDSKDMTFIEDYKANFVPHSPLGKHIDPAEVLQLISAVDFCCVFLLDESQRHCIAGGIQRTPAGAATCANRVDGAAAKDSRANQK